MYRPPIHCKDEQQDFLCLLCNWRKPWLYDYSRVTLRPKHGCRRLMGSLVYQCVPIVASTSWAETIPI